MRSVLSAMRAMLTELKLAPQDWVSVLPAIATALNEASLDRLGRRPDGIAYSPLEVMTGITPKRQVLRVLPPDLIHTKAKNISHARTIQVITVKELQASLDQMHKDVQASVSKKGEKAIHRHNRATNIVYRRFLLVTSFSFAKQRTAATSSVLNDTSTYRVHAARLLKYKDSLNGAEVTQDIIDLAGTSESRYEVVSKIVDLGEDKDGIWFRVIWDGLPDECDWTWHLAATLFADVPDMVLDYLSQSKETNLVAKTKRQLGISA
eukprot:IDg1965t1